MKKNPSSSPGRQGFKELRGVKVPDLLQFRINTSMRLKERWDMCPRSCSCSAYSNTNIWGKRSGCLLWFGDLIDMRQLDELSSDQKVFIRVLASVLGNASQCYTRGQPSFSCSNTNCFPFCVSVANSKKKRWFVAAAVSAFIPLALLLILFDWRTSRKVRGMF